MVIKQIDVFSAGKIAGIIMATFGLLAGLMFFGFSSIFSSALGSALGQDGAGMGMIGGLMGIIVMPILYGIFGFIGGVLQAFIYNVAAGFVGGIRVQTE